MTTPIIGAAPPARSYRLYLPASFKIMIPVILVLFTLLGVAMVLGTFPDRQARFFGMFWLVVVGVLVRGPGNSLPD